MPTLCLGIMWITSRVSQHYTKSNTVVCVRVCFLKNLCSCLYIITFFYSLRPVLAQIIFGCFTCPVYPCVKDCMVKLQGYRE
jgi:hypothetical protein